MNKLDEELELRIRPRAKEMAPGVLPFHQPVVLLLAELPLCLGFRGLDGSWRVVFAHSTAPEGVVTGGSGNNADSRGHRKAA